MAQKFYFDDEFDEDVVEIPQTTKSKPKPKQKTKSKKTTIKKPEDSETNGKKNHKKLYIFLGICAALVVGLIIYCVVLSMQKGPIYGKRCAGLQTTITSGDMDEAKSKVESKYSNIDMISYEVACKQVKIDINFKGSISATQAEKIGQDAATILDDVVGVSKKEGQAYSDLFGVIDGNNQYEINLYLTGDTGDFPIYGTKTCQSDKFGFTLASVKDSASAKKAQDTLKK